MAYKRALIVDDSSTAQYRLKKMLRAYPLDIDVVDSGEAALRYLAHHAPDVIFMDHTMPGMDGFRALQIIKSHPETAMIPVIMYTAQSGDLYTGQARALGALDVVSKDSINATDLSKVLHAIHVFEQGSEPDPSTTTAPIETPELIAAANAVSDTTYDVDMPHPLHSVSPRRGDENRNLDLRLSHMEHTLEDNRRFITSRLMRELTSLRKQLRSELTEVVKEQFADQAAPPPMEDPVKPPSRVWPYALTSAVIGLGALGLYGYSHIDRALDMQKDQQAIIGLQLQEIAENTRPLAATTPTTDSFTPATADRHFLDDLAWTFNQQASLAFQQNSIDPRPLLRVHELLHRLASNGFKGTANLTIYVGNFCVTLDSMGAAQLAGEETSLGNCMLSSEIYMIERLMDDYTREAQMLLSNVSRHLGGSIQLIIHAAEGPDVYPERLPIVSARDWNAVAHKNNRLELTLLADAE